MSFLIRSLRNAIRGQAPPLGFPTSGFEIISDSLLLEEERLDEFKGGQYYPVNIGDVYHEKYQVLGKLGFGTTSTVWLAHDLQYVRPISSAWLPSTI